jgi:hypothetical protein
MLTVNRNWDWILQGAVSDHQTRTPGQSLFGGLKQKPHISPEITGS